MAKPFHPKLFMFYNQQWNKNTVTWRQSQDTDDTTTQTTNLRLWHSIKRDQRSGNIAVPTGAQGEQGLSY
jgi:hypothetical protein